MANQNDQEFRKEPILPSLSPQERQQRRERLAAWLHFPRRLLVLLLAFALAWAVILALQAALSSDPAMGGPPSLLDERVGAFIIERLPNSLLLIGAALPLALLLAVVLALLAVLVHSIGRRVGPLGSLLKALGRLVTFALAALPVAALGLLLVYLLALRLELLPAVGMVRPGEGNNLFDMLRHLIMPAFSLALLPAVLTAQAVAHQLTLPRQNHNARAWLAALCKLLAVLLGQIGGLFSALVLVEVIFAWPGVGRMAYDALMRFQMPLLLGALAVLAVLVLIGRLGAELFRALERLLQPPRPSSPPETTPWQRTARRVGLILTLVLLLLPLGLTIAGLAVGSDAAVTADLAARNQPPSAEHPWGADQLGRDLQARLLRGTLNTLAITTVVALAILIPTVAAGALSGYLDNRRTWWAELLADLLLLPADALLFLPALPIAMALAVLGLQTVGQEGLTGWLILVVAVVLLPRTVRLYRALWAALPEQRRGRVLGLAGTALLLLGAILGGVWLMTALDVVGMGLRPPTATLGNMLGENMRMLQAFALPALLPIAALAACALPLYLAIDVLLGYFTSKEPLARLNE